jgi:hypothetical protein
MCNKENVINGWEYVTEIIPGNLSSEQKLQDSYLQHYNLAYHNFLKSLCIDKDNLRSIVEELKYTIDPKTKTPITKYRCVIDTTDENDIINKDDDYPIKFLRSKFINFKSKKLKTDLISYYKPLGFYVKGPFQLVINNKINKYFIELYWNNNNNNTE